MNSKPGYRLGGLVLALSLGLATIGVADAQQSQPGGGTGVLIGEVDKCVNGNETPTSGVNVGVAGGSQSLAKSDGSGDFVLMLAPGQYTVQATADDGTSATRPYVPVEANTSLDIGVLELAGGCEGADMGAVPAPAPAQPTAQPTAAPTDVPATPTTAPAVAQPTPTAPDQTAPTDQSSPDDSSNGD
jgi:Carboxypeptidase regulatory-like domain